MKKSLRQLSSSFSYEGQTFCIAVEAIENPRDLVSVFGFSFEVFAANRKHEFVFDEKKEEDTITILILFPTLSGFKDDD